MSADNEAQFLRATIIDRDNEMVLDIPEQPESAPYLIRGKKVEHFYAGTDVLEHGSPVDVVARWSLLGDVYVGIWIEDGTDWFMCFRRPRPR